ncbi:MAG: hypothetical protein ACE5GM_05260 [bacterium]
MRQGNNFKFRYEIDWGEVKGVYDRKEAKYILLPGTGYMKYALPSRDEFLGGLKPIKIWTFNYYDAFFAANTIKKYYLYDLDTIIPEYF